MKDVVLLVPAAIIATDLIIDCICTIVEGGLKIIV